MRLPGGRQAQTVLAHGRGCARRCATPGSQPAGLGHWYDGSNRTPQHPIAQPRANQRILPPRFPEAPHAHHPDPARRHRPRRPRARPRPARPGRAPRARDLDRHPRPAHADRGLPDRGRRPLGPDLRLPPPRRLPRAPRSRRPLRHDPRLRPPARHPDRRDRRHGRGERHPRRGLALGAGDGRRLRLAPRGLPLARRRDRHPLRELQPPAPAPPARGRPRRRGARRPPRRPRDPEPAPAPAHRRRAHPQLRRPDAPRARRDLADELGSRSRTRRHRSWPIRAISAHSRTLQKQAAWREACVVDQVRRLLGAGSPPEARLRPPIRSRPRSRPPAATGVAARGLSCFRMG